MNKLLCYIAFHPFLPVHITKDTGKIPEAIGKLPGWHAQIIRFNKENLTHPEREIPHVDIITQSPRRFWKIDINLIWYIVKHAPNFDVLLLYHFDLNTFIYGILFKWFNRNGFLWNKLDLNEDVIRDLPDILQKHELVGRLIYQKLMKAFISSVDLISAESKRNLNSFQAQFPDTVDKLRYIPNGIDPASMPEVENVPREQIILTAARLGIWEKGTDILLEAYAQSKVWPDWKLILIGNVDESFQPWVVDFKHRHPETWKSVQWVNHIDSREELAHWYQRAMIFCIPSRVESFAMALVEAGFYGCACIASDFASAYDILDYGNCGVLCPRGQTEELAKQLANLCTDPYRISFYRSKVTERIRDQFDLEKIIDSWYTEYQTRRNK